MNKENIVLDFAEYLKENNIALNSEEEAEQQLKRFMEEKNIDPLTILDDAYDDEEEDEAYHYLELAEEASSEREALKYAKKALEISPENWDAACMVAELTAKTPESLLEKLEKTIQQADAVMEHDGWFSEDCIGGFWGLYETRPYMRLRSAYLHILLNCGMLKKAVAQAEEMLRLSENDNLGVRYCLMHLYAYFEDEEGALALLKKYDEESTMFMLPLSILYYKLGDLKTAARYLRKLNRRNPDTRRFFETLINSEAEELLEEIGTFGYRPFTIQEFAVAFEENAFLFGTVAGYFCWGLKKLKTMK